MLPRLAALMFLLLLTLPAAAQTWTSPDGRLLVSVPDATRYTALPKPPPPLEAVWVSADDTTRLAITRNILPAHVRLNQASVEKGLAEEVGGQVTRLPTRQIAGHDVWLMKAEAGESEITQALVKIDNTVYKLMAFTSAPAANDAAIQQFLSSLAIGPVPPLAPPPTPAATPGSAAPELTNSPTSSDAVPLPDGDSGPNLARWLGRGVGVLLVGLVVYFLAVRFSKKS
jgi:hypothetical protein